MNEQELAKYKKEMRGYAQTYSMFFHAATREEFIKDNALSDKTLKGKWISLHTDAIPVSLKREDGSKLRVLVVTKKNHTSTNCTGLLWLHGGGYAIGLPELDVPFAERFLEEDNCVMVLPDYTRSVDAPYPAALMDAYQTLLWMKDHAEALGIREDQLFVGGESAGGGLACALTLYARDQGKVKIAFQMPLYPMLDDRMTETSSHNTSPLWDTKKNLAAWKIYRGEKKETSPYFAPARETNYKDLPPAFSIITDNEPFYAETKTYFQNLYQAGVPILLKEYPGCFHSFDINCPNTKAAKDASQLEKKVFHYAQKNYFAFQTKESVVILAEEPTETEIQKMIEDIETQHEILASHREEPVEEEKPVEIVPVNEEESEEAVPEMTSVPEESQKTESSPVEEPVPEETVAEVTSVPEEPQETESSPVEEEIPTEPAIAEEETIPEVLPIQEETEASAVEEKESIEPTPVEEPAEEETAPEVEPILEEIEEAEPVLVEESPAVEEIQKAEEPSVEVEERPVSEGTTVEFPVHPSEKKETISDAEIDQISSELTQIDEEVPPEFEEVPEAEEVVEEISEEPVEETEPVKESFTREDVMNLLRKKDETRMNDDLKPYNNEKENILDNLQKIIEEDTTSSIEEINHLVDKL